MQVLQDELNEPPPPPPQVSAKPQPQPYAVVPRNVQAKETKQALSAKAEDKASEEINVVGSAEDVKVVETGGGI